MPAASPAAPTVEFVRPGPTALRWLRDTVAALKTGDPALSAANRAEVGAAVENVTDKHYGVMGFDNTGVNGLAQLYPGNPRWWKAHVIYHF